MANLLMNNEKIKNLGYWSLVNLLTTSITPETRKSILDRLTEMNDRLLLENSPLDLTRGGYTNRKKKDIVENTHPSMDVFNYNGSNPLPLAMPVNSAYGFNILSNIGNNKETQSEIDLDDILDDIENEPDELDQKLDKISKLYRKIVIDRRNRKKLNKQS